MCIAVHVTFFILIFILIFIQTGFVKMENHIGRKDSTRGGCAEIGWGVFVVICSEKNVVTFQQLKIVKEP